jgi:hypothetical protein
MMSFRTRSLGSRKAEAGQAETGQAETGQAEIRERADGEVAEIVTTPTIVPAPLGVVLQAQRGGRLAPYLGSGWSFEETWGRWTEGKRASLVFPFATTRDVPGSIDFTVRAYVPIEASMQRVTVYVGDEQESATWEFHDNILVTHTIVLGADLFRKLPDLKFLVEFEIHQPTSPLSHGLGYDTRELGLGIISVRMNSSVGRASG